MKLAKFQEILNATVVNKIYDPEIEYKYAFGSDLMSDVLAFIKNEDTILITGLVNSQVIRTAEMIDLKAIVFVRGKVPSPDVVEMADENDITLLSTSLSLFSASGVLFNNGVRGLELGE